MTIAIVGALIALLLPAVTKMMGKGDVATAKSDLGRIVGAWENYYREYGKWPVGAPGPGNIRLFNPYGASHEQVATEGSAGMQMLVGVMTNIMYPSGEFDTGGGTALMNKHAICTNFNAKRIQFMNYSAEVLDTSGNMVDPWGNAYWFMFDLNKDGRVQRGGAAATQVFANVIAWSLGPDGALSADDVKSWE